jgi:hypothetical protein
MQVSDRRVSLRTAPPLPFDVLANKTVVYFGRRGIVSISYAGLAYIAGRTTDRWLAETLSGVDLSVEAALAIGNAISHPFDVGQALEHLRRRATEAYAREPYRARREITDFQVIGSQWDRRHRRLRPVICNITNQRTRSAPFEKLNTQRHWDIQKDWCSIGSGTGQKEAREYLRQRFRASGGLISPEHCLDVMVDAVRYIAGLHPDLIGQDCMCVHIQGAQPMVSVSFRPKTQYRLSTPSGPIYGPIAFTPYVVARDMVAIPSISANNMLLRTPGVDIKFDGTGLVMPGWSAAWQRHFPRPGPPGSPRKAPACCHSPTCVPPAQGREHPGS